MYSAANSGSGETASLGASVRVGSPFALGTNAFRPLVPNHSAVPESYTAAGSLGYTAMGAVTASAAVFLFAIVGVFWFPVGGVLIASLGLLLALFGLLSKYRYQSLGLLVTHGIVFVASYSKMIG